MNDLDPSRSFWPQDWRIQLGLVRTGVWFLFLSFFLQDYRCRLGASAGLLFILDSLLYSGPGLLNRRMRQLHPDAKFAPLRRRETQTYLRHISANAPPPEES